MLLFFSEGLFGGKEVFPSAIQGMGFLPSLGDSECGHGFCKTTVKLLSVIGYYDCANRLANHYNCEEFEN